jgi:hypothetical protein
MNIPAAVQLFFTAHDEDSIAEAFTAGAVVRDEGHTHRGRQAIRAWRIAARAQYQFVAEPFEALSQDDIVTVRARVSGNFPGSPVVLDYRFQLADARIARLEIK